MFWNFHVALLKMRTPWSKSKRDIGRPWPRLEPEFLDTFLLLQISDRNYYYVNHFIYIKAIVTLWVFLNISRNHVIQICPTQAGLFWWNFFEVIMPNESKFRYLNNISLMYSCLLSSRTFESRIDMDTQLYIIMYIYSQTFCDGQIIDGKWNYHSLHIKCINVLCRK